MFNTVKISNIILRSVKRYLSAATERSTSLSCTTKFYPMTASAKKIKHIHFSSVIPYTLGNDIQEYLVSKSLEYKKHQILSRNPDYKPDFIPQPLISTILSFEFESTYTGGKREKTQTSEEKRQIMESTKNVKYVQTSRGGQVTYHGPGQVVIYPIIDLSTYHKLTSKCYVSTLEKSVVALLRSSPGIGLDALTTENTGVWVKDPRGSLKKISSLGVNVRRSVTSHGVSINYSTDLSFVNDPNIIMCGLSDYKQTSIVNEWVGLGKEKAEGAELAQVGGLFTSEFATRVGVDVVESYVCDFQKDDKEIFTWLDKVISGV